MEISVLNRFIYIVYSNDDREIMTIEIKLRDWRKAVRQAIDHQLYADKSYICLPRPHKGANVQLVALLEQHGIGLIWFDTNASNEVKVEEFIEARRNDFRWAPARRKIESMLYA